MSWNADRTCCCSCCFCSNYSRMRRQADNRSIPSQVLSRDVYQAQWGIEKELSDLQRAMWHISIFGPVDWQVNGTRIFFLSISFPFLTVLYLTQHHYTALATKPFQIYISWFVNVYIYAIERVPLKWLSQTCSERSPKRYKQKELKAI